MALVRAGEARRRGRPTCGSPASTTISKTWRSSPPPSRGCADMACASRYPRLERRSTAELTVPCLRLRRAMPPIDLRATSRLRRCGRFEAQARPMRRRRSPSLGEATPVLVLPRSGLAAKHGASPVNATRARSDSPTTEARSRPSSSTSTRVSLSRSRSRRPHRAAGHHARGRGRVRAVRGSARHRSRDRRVRQQRHRRIAAPSRPRLSYCT